MVTKLKKKELCPLGAVGAISSINEPMLFSFRDEIILKGKDSEIQIAKIVSSLSCNSEYFKKFDFSSNKIEDLPRYGKLISLENGLGLNESVGNEIAAQVYLKKNKMSLNIVKSKPLRLSFSSPNAVLTYIKAAKKKYIILYKKPSDTFINNEWYFNESIEGILDNYFKYDKNNSYFKLINNSELRTDNEIINTYIDILSHDSSFTKFNSLFKFDGIQDQKFIKEIFYSEALALIKTIDKSIKILSPNELESHLKHNEDISV